MRLIPRPDGLRALGGAARPRPGSDLDRLRLHHDGTGHGRAQRSQDRTPIRWPESPPSRMESPVRLYAGVNEHIDRSRSPKLGNVRFAAGASAEGERPVPAVLAG